MHTEKNDLNEAEHETKLEIKKKRRGFAVMDPEKRAAIARKGGKAAHAKGSAHKFSKEEAAIAGRKGGIAVHEKRKAARAEEP